MWTKTSEGQRLIRELSRDVIVEAVPEEIDLFDELVAEYFQNPNPPASSTPSKEDPLGFGVEEILIAATPAAAAMVDIVLNYLISEVLKATREESAESIRKKIRTLFGNDNKDREEPAPLTREQLEQVKKLSRKQAIKFGIGPEKAEKMADALVGSLALK